MVSDFDDVRWHAEMSSSLNYETAGRDNDYSEINIQDTLTFFNPKQDLRGRLPMTPRRFCLGQPHRDRGPTAQFTSGLAVAPGRLVDLKRAPQARQQLGLAATVCNMWYRDQLVATGALGDVGNVVRVNVEGSYVGAQTRGGMAGQPVVSMDANATFSDNHVNC